MGRIRQRRQMTGVVFVFLTVVTLLVSVQHVDAATGVLSGTISASGQPVPAGSVQAATITYSNSSCTTPSGKPLLVATSGVGGSYSQSVETGYYYKILYKPLTTAPSTALFRWYKSGTPAGVTNGALATCLSPTASGLAGLDLSTSGEGVRISGSLVTSTGAPVTSALVALSPATPSWYQTINGYVARASDAGTWDITGIDANTSNMYLQVITPALGSGTLFFVKREANSYSLVSPSDVATCAESCKFSLTTSNLSGLNLQLPVMGRITGTVSGPNGPVGDGEICATAFKDGVTAATMYSNIGGTACTNSNGIYDIGLVYGSYRVQFQAQRGANYKGEWYNNVSVLAGYGSASTITLTAASATATADATLEAGKFLSGRITDFRGNPVAAATAQAMATDATTGMSAAVAYAITDADGQFTIKGLDAGAFGLMVSHPDYGMAWLGGSRETATSITIGSSDSGSSGNNLTYPRSFGVRGRIDTGDNSPARVCVAAYRVSDTGWGWGDFVASSCFDAPSLWALKGLVPGDYRFRFDAQTGNVKSTFLGGTDFSTATITTLGGSDISGMDVTLPAGKSISGRIFNSNPSPIYNACVSATLVDSNGFSPGTYAGTSCTNTNGEFLIRGLGDGTYNLRIEPPQATDYTPGYYSSLGSPTKNFIDGTQITIGTNDSVVNTVSQTLQTGPKFTGRIVASGTPVPNVCVSAFKDNNSWGGWGEWSGSGCSGTDGKFSIRGLALGNYRIQVNAYSSDYQVGWHRTGLNTTADVASASLVAVALPSADLGDISLISGKKATGNITSGGNPVAGACVDALADNGTEWGTWSGSGCTNAKGDFSVRGLDPTKSYRFRVNVFAGDFRPGFVDGAGQVQTSSSGISALAASNDISLGTISLVTAPSIKGTIVSGASTREANVCINAHDSTTLQWIAGACSAANGTFALRGLSNGGSYKLSWWTQRPLLTNGWYKESVSGATQDPSPANATTITIDSNGRSGLEIRLSNGGTISGTLASGFCVAAWLQPGSQSAQRTDASAVSCASQDGKYELKGLLPSTDYYLQVFKQDASAVTQTSPGANVAVRTGSSNTDIVAS
mgnify:CR=1 FL=1